MTNELKAYYQDVYSKDKNSHFLKYREGRKLSESHEWSIKWISENLKNKGSVLDFGAGEGDFLGALHSWSQLIAVDYSDKALVTAKQKYPSLELIQGDEKVLENYNQGIDLVVSFGTLEHMDRPFETFAALVSAVRPGGHLIVSCPSFLNTRGIIWMTLAKLLKVPMSLSDKHALSIADFKKFEEKDGRVKLIDYKSTDFQVSYGDYFFIDMKKRLTNALRDAKLDNSHVDDLLEWVYDNQSYLPQNEFSGVEGTYIFKRLV